MDKEFKLPDPGEGIHEAEITEILVSKGDSVKEGQPVMGVETDKASFELPSPYEGTVKEIRVKLGDQVRVGDVLMIFSVEKEAEPSEQAPGKPAQPGKAEPAAEAGEQPEGQLQEKKNRENRPGACAGRTGNLPARARAWRGHRWRDTERALRPGYPRGCQVRGRGQTA